MRIKIELSDGRGYPAGKLADAELHFTDGPLAGLKLIGFTVWSRKGSWNNPEYNVTMPARSYAVNGERRSFALLRSISGNLEAHAELKAAIIDAYQATVSPPPASAVRPNQWPKPAPIVAPPPAQAAPTPAWTIPPSTPTALDELYGTDAPQTPEAQGFKVEGWINQAPTPPPAPGAPGTYTRNYPIDLPTPAPIVTRPAAATAPPLVDVDF